MQLVHTVKNNGPFTHNISLGLEYDLDIYSSDGTHSDYFPQKNIPPFKGVESYYKEKSFKHLLRDHPNVTNVDAYIYTRQDTSFWTNLTDFSPLSDGNKVYFSWQNREIKAGETLEFKYVIGIVITEYNLTLTEPLLEAYKPNTPLTLELTMNTLESGNKVNILSSINDTKLNTYDFVDNGYNKFFFDAFLTPPKGGVYKLSYKISSPKFGISIVNFYLKILNMPPTVYVVDKLKKSYYSNETVNVSINIKDETYATLYIVSESHVSLFEKRIDCNGFTRNINASFQIPEFYPDTYHNLSIYAVNEKNLSSDKEIFFYELTRFRSALITLVDPLPPHYRSGDKINVIGIIMTRDPRTTVCIYSAVNDQNNKMHNCMYFNEPTESNFVFKTNFTGIEDKFYDFKIYGVDNRQIESNTLHHNFYIYDSKFKSKCPDISYFNYDFALSYVIFITIT